MVLFIPEKKSEIIRRNITSSLIYNNYIIFSQLTYLGGLLTATGESCSFLLRPFTSITVTKVASWSCPCEEVSFSDATLSDASEWDFLSCFEISLMHMCAEKDSLLVWLSWDKIDTSADVLCKKQIFLLICQILFKHKKIKHKRFKKIVYLFFERFAFWPFRQNTTKSYFYATTQVIKKGQKCVTLLITY